MIAKLAPILGITFIDILGFSILIPLMPYYVRHFGAPVVVVGALFSAFALCQLIAGPVWGNISDRIGRKRVLIVSQIGATIGWTMLAFAPNIGMVFLARIVEGLSGGNISVTQAYVSDLVEPAERGRAFSYIGATFSAGLIFGPAAGGTLVAHYGYTAPFLAAALLQLVTLALTIAVLPESRAPVENEALPTFRAIATALRDPRVAPVLWQKLAFSMGLYGWFAAFVLILQRQLGLNVQSSSYLFAAFGFANVVLQLGVVTRVIAFFGRNAGGTQPGVRASSNLGFVSLVVAFGIVPFIHHYASAAVMVVFFSLGLSLENASIPALLSEAAPENMRGTVLGVGSSLESGAGVIMPPISTATFGAYGVPPTAAISSAFVLVALAIGLTIARGDAARIPAVE